MSQTTRATQDLKKAGIPFETYAYTYQPGSERIGLQAAEALGEPAARVLKTLMAELDGKPVIVVIPSDRELSLKRLAAALKGKAARMLPPADAERITGYHVGGISPFGQKRRLPVLIEEAALSEPYVFVNGGQRGLQLRLLPADLQRAASAVAAPLAA